MWGPPEMPYALNLVKLGFLVLIPGASNWPSEPTSIQEHPVIVAEQKLQHWTARSSANTGLQSFNSSRRSGDGTYFGLGYDLPDMPLKCTGLGYKVVPRFGEFCYCSCLSPLPGFACSIHATWGPPFSQALFVSGTLLVLVFQWIL